MQKGEGQLIPSLTLGAKVRTAPGMALDAFMSTFLEGISTPPSLPARSSTLFHFGQTKENRIPDIFSTYNYLHK